jgi:hypothetical protein
MLRILFQGKFVEILFNMSGQPDGGKISNFLLEKVSVLLLEITLSWQDVNVALCLSSSHVLYPRILENVITTCFINFSEVVRKIARVMVVSCA